MTLTEAALYVVAAFAGGFIGVTIASVYLRATRSDDLEQRVRALEQHLMELSRSFSESQRDFAAHLREREP